MSESFRLRVAQPADLSLLMQHIKDFYAEDRVVLHRERVEAGLKLQLADPRNGTVLILSTDALDFAGYINLGWCFSIEQGGRFVLLDELYVVPAARGGGLGKKALAIAADWAREQGAAVMRLEVNHHNTRAKALYLSFGCVDDERDMLTFDLNASR